MNKKTQQEQQQQQPFSVFLPQAWPEDALEMVAHKFLDDVEMSDEIRAETVVMCKHFHESVRAMSDRYVIIVPLFCSQEERRFSRVFIIVLMLGCPALHNG